MWLDSVNERNAIRSGLAGPLEDLATLDFFWINEPEGGRHSPASSLFSRLRALFATCCRPGWSRSGLTSFSNEEWLSRLS